MKLDLGVRANGKRVDVVKLPKWARTPQEFLQKQREALESDYVSQNLHMWIDLIFGVKQDSIEDNNVFHPCTYQNKVKQSVLNDPIQRRAFEVQISEFGQTPKQIFFKKHPQKFSDVIKPQFGEMPKMFASQQKEVEEYKEVYKPKDSSFDVNVQRNASNSDDGTIKKSNSLSGKIQEIPRDNKAQPKS
jgi:hypothetical protein